MEIAIEIMGWVASVLIVGAYALNIKGKLDSHDKRYVWANLVGGFFFIINTAYHQAYPSAVVNVVWVLIAADSLLRHQKRK